VCNASEREFHIEMN